MPGALVAGSRVLPLLLRRGRASSRRASRPASRLAPVVASSRGSPGPPDARGPRQRPHASAIRPARRAPGSSRRALLVTAASVFVALAPRAARADASASPFTALGGAGAGPPGGDPSSCAPVRGGGGAGTMPFSAAAAAADDAPGPAAAADADVLGAHPGTALTRMETCRARAASLTEAQLSGDWEDVRGLLLWAAGLRDLRDVPPGQGNTGHCFNDFNHVDATTMTLDVSDNENRGAVRGIAFGNQLGPGIRVASDPEPGPGGSWCTCCQGGAAEPPADVAHVQFRSRIAFKLVWVPGRDGAFTRFVLVDDEGAELATGVPTGAIPNERERRFNYEVLKGGRYAEAADARSAP